ncbi:MAG: competence protein ComE, partial [Sphaerospermopsis sp. SIO1G2]|nr:competence protein ComE [Sphaerospermopsis sp. SIO1G2]
MFISPHFRYLSFFCLFVLTLFGCQQVQSSRQRLSPLPQDPLIQVYFNNSQSSEYQENYRQKKRLGDDLEQQIIDVISQAESTIDIAVQELRLPRIAKILAKKQQAGVKVRLILENNYSRPYSSLNNTEIQKLNSREKARYNQSRQFIDVNQDNQITSEEISQRDALFIIQNNNIPWLDDTADGSLGSGLMHHKFVVIDNRFVIVTSANFTLSDTSGDFNNPQSLGNANNLIKIDSSQLATLFTEEFNIMWGDGPGGKNDSKFGVKKPIRPPKTINLVNGKLTVNFSPISPSQPWSKSIFSMALSKVLPINPLLDSLQGW